MRRGGSSTSAMALNERHESSMIEQLPVDITTKNVEYLDIATHCKLAGWNSTLQRRIYREVFKRGRRLTFDASTALSCQSLTDDALSRLFIRVNAQEVTTELNLGGCEDIRGPGLMPLRHSRVLNEYKLVPLPPNTRPRS